MLHDYKFEQACKLQSTHFAQASEFGIECNRVVFQAAINAAAYADNPRVPHFVGSGTGTGKTTFCLSLMAVCHAETPNYSAAYVVGTIAEAQRAYGSLTRVLPTGVVDIHTSGHQSEVLASEHGEEVLTHFRTRGPTSRANLKKHPIIVCTHELWMREGIAERDFGIREFNGAPRQHVFVDEFPDMIATNEVVLSDLEDLADEVERCADYSIEAGLIRKSASASRAMRR